MPTDKVAASLSLVAILVIAIIVTIQDLHPIYLVACSVGGICSLGYLVLGDRLQTGISCSDSAPWLPRYIWSVLLLILALVLYLMRSQEYVMPMTYYLCMSTSVALLFWCTLATGGRKQTIAVLCLVTGIGLTYLWTTSMMFPSLIGIDPWTHMRITTQEMIVATGGKPDTYGISDLTITTIGGYYSLMHIWLWKIMSTTGLGYKIVTLVFWSSLQVVANVVLVFLIGNRLFNRKVGLVAALVMATGNWVLFFNSWAIPNTLGATLALGVVYAGIMWHETGHKWWLTVLPVLLAIGMGVHLVTAMWVLGTSSCILMLPILLKKHFTLHRATIQVGKAAVIPAIMLLILVAWLQFTTLGASVEKTIREDGTPAYTIGKAPVAPATEIASTAPPAASTPTTDSTTPSDITTVPPTTTPDGTLLNGNGEPEEPMTYRVSDQLQGSLGELTIDSIGMFLYFGIALAGCFVMIQRKRPLRIMWVVLCLTVLGIGFLPQLAGVSLLEHRWWYLAQVLLAIPLGVALLRGARITARWYVVPIVMTVVWVMVFLSTVGLPNNMTNRLFSPNLIARYALTEGEMVGKAIAESYSPMILGADPYMMSYIHSDAYWHYPINQKALSAEKNIIHGDFGDSPCDVIILRTALRTEPFAFGSGSIYRLESDPVRMAKESGYVVVFDNGEIQVLVRGDE